VWLEFLWLKKQSGSIDKSILCEFNVQFQVTRLCCQAVCLCCFLLLGCRQARKTRAKASRSDTHVELTSNFQYHQAGGMS
jgi:hypothetical protein